jgi:hypothetical protein
MRQGKFLMGGTMSKTVKERPIIFSGEMVRAILDGRKTQTRRVMRPQPGAMLFGVCGWYGTGEKNRKHYASEAHFRKGVVQDFPAYGERGDRLWVRETWARRGCKKNCGHLSCHTIYKADEVRAIGAWGCVTWKPSIHMPRWASRITLEVTAVRVERVCDISFDDIHAEGVRGDGHPEIDMPHRDDEHSARIYFGELWDSINEKRGYGWEVDPWVWVVEFQRVENG